MMSVNNCNDNVYEFFGEITEPIKVQQEVEEVRYSKPRSRTDFFFFLLNIGFIAVLFILFGYCFFNGTIYRQIYGYDNCGNVCGLENAGNTDQSCLSPDKRNHKLLQFSSQNGTRVKQECVEKCNEDYVQQRTFCLPKEVSDKIDLPVSDLKLDAIGISLCVALGFAYIILVLLRYATKIVVWFVIGTFVVLLFIILIVCFYYGLWLGAITTFLVGLILLLLFIKRREKMKFVIKLFKEAATSLMDMPLLLFEPMLTVLSVIIATAFGVYFVLVITSAGTFNKDLCQFEQNALMKFTYWLNFFVYFWFVQFIVGCQHFVVASTISQWYFTRNKSLVRRPICRAFSDLVIFHLGTICLGSLLLTIIKILRAIMRAIKRSMRRSNNVLAIVLTYVYDFLLRIMEDAISFLSSNAYIVTAIDGLPFIAAGKRAVHLIFTNFGEKLAAELVGEIVIWTLKLFIFSISFLIGLEWIITNYDETPILTFCIIIVLSFIVANVMMSTFESTVDTLFICYSIDSEENDGFARPYFMSDDLKNTMFEAKQLAPPAGAEPQQV